MKRRALCLLVLLLLGVVMPMHVMAQDVSNLLTGKTICIDPAKGSLSSVGNPLPTIGVAVPSTASTDYYASDYVASQNNAFPSDKINAYYESVVNLDIAKRLEQKLVAAGATVVLTRGTIQDNPTDEVRLATVQGSGADYFVSIEANKHFEGSTNNYLSLIYRGDNASKVEGNSEYTAALEQQNAAAKAWRYLFESMGEGFETLTGNYTYHNKKVGWQNVTVMEHDVPGFVSSSYFSSYQPIRQRALSSGWRDQEATRLFRAILKYFGKEEQVGAIMGVVKCCDVHMVNDENISTTSYSYVVGTHDQYKPLNGAEVILYQGYDAANPEANKQATYTVDNNYNGVFVFSGLAPGTYQVVAKNAGHYQQMQNVEVVSNETTYPIFLLSEQGTDTLLEKIDFIKRWDVTYDGTAIEREDGTTVTFDAIQGTIRRTLQWRDNIIILSHDNTTREPYLYAINHRTQKLSKLSTKGMGGYNAAKNPREYMTLSDIAITKDNKLIGCNFVTCYYGDDEGYVEEGGVRDSLKIYKWETIDANPILWVSKSTGGVGARENYHCVGLSKGADMGYTLAVNGASDNCVITLTGVDHSYTILRYAHISVVNDEIAGGTYTKSGLDNPQSFLDVMGKYGAARDYRLNNSPLGDERWVIDGSTITASEFIQTTSGAYNTISGSMPMALFGGRAVETHYVEYNGHVLAIAPYYEHTYANPEDEEVRDADGKVTALQANSIQGVHIVDLSKHDFDLAELVTTNTDLDVPVATPTDPTANQYASATAYVDGGYLHVFLIIDNRIVKFSTATKEQEAESNASRDIYAYGLNYVDTRGDHSEYTLTFATNETPIDGKGTLYFYYEGQEVHQIEVEGLERDKSVTYTLQTADLYAAAAAKGITLKAGDELTWAVEVEAHKVRNWSLVGSVTGFTRAYHAVDKSPESPNMGRIYVVQGRAKATYEESKDGVYVIEPTYKLHSINGSSTALKPILDGETAWYMPRRPSVDSEGTLYVPERATDGGKAHSGVFIAKSDSILSGNFKPLFAGTRTNGIFIYKNGDEEIYTGASSTSTCIYGKGGDTKLIAINTPLRGGTLAPNGLHVYNLGQRHGNILTSWNKVQSDAIDIGYSGIEENKGAMEVCLHATEHGVFVGTNREITQNSTSSAIQFYDWDGNVLYKSYVNEDIYLARGGGFVVSSDERILVMNNQKADKTYEFLIYDVLWIGGKPSLSLRERMPHTHGDILQMSFDYAGNLIVSGSQGLFVYATPSIAANKRTTPARSELTIVMPEQGVTSNGRAIYAYDLKAEEVLNNNTKIPTGEYTFSFKVNNNATAATLVFYEKGTTKELGRIPLPTMPVVGETYTYTLHEKELPSPSACPIAEIDWGVEVAAHPIEAITQIYKEESQQFNYLTNAVDNSPESPYFGNIYVMNYVARRDANNGLYKYDLMYNLQNTTPYTGNPDPHWNRPQRMAVDADGYIYISDWGDDHPGIFIADPADLSGTVTPFFAGTFDNNGLYANHSGGSSAACAVYGTGAKKMLFVHNEDVGGTLTKNSIARYDIGKSLNADGSPKQWTTAPSKVYTILPAPSSRILTMVPAKKGFFVGNYRAGTEDDDYQVLYYFDLDQNRLYGSHSSGTDEIVGSNTQVAFALTKQEDRLVLDHVRTVDGTTIKELLVFDVTWSGTTPTLTFVDRYQYDFGNILQMNFDYAGNLIITTGSNADSEVGADGGFYVYALPKARNVCMTPARTSIKRVVETEPSEHPVRSIFAYDLRVEGATTAPEGEKTHIEPNVSTNAYKFTFMANETAQKAEIIFYSDAERTNALKRIEIPAVTAGSNSITISARDLPENNGKALAWSIELTGEDITEWGLLSEEKMVLQTGLSAINNNPQTDRFGRIYTYYKSNTEGDANAGAFIYTPLEDKMFNPQQANSPFEGKTLNVARMTTDDAGNLYLADKGTDVPGIYVGTFDDATNRDKVTFAPFFDHANVNKHTIVESNEPYTFYTTKEKDATTGTYHDIGGATMGVDMIQIPTKDRGTQHVILAYVKGRPDGKAAGTDTTAIPYHSVVCYELGTDEATLKRTWSTQPTKIVDLVSGHRNSAHVGDVWATEKGFFVCHSRTGTQDSWASALMFYDVENTKTFTSGDAKDANVYAPLINGADGAAMALTGDNKTLVLHNKTQQFLVFDVTWQPSGVSYTPILSLRAVYNHGHQTINQMDFDYAGNLITTGPSGKATYAIPDPNKRVNRMETPAMNNLLVIRNALTHDRCFDSNEAQDVIYWHNSSNWVEKQLPTENMSVLIRTNCVVKSDGPGCDRGDLDAAAQKIDILVSKEVNGTTVPVTLTIEPNNALTVTEEIRFVRADNLEKRLAWSELTDEERALGPRIILKADTVHGTGVLAHFDAQAETYATVEFASNHAVNKGNNNEPNRPQWQHIGMPFDMPDATKYLLDEANVGLWIYRWDETKQESKDGWVAMTGMDRTLNAFQGYMFMAERPHTWTLTDKLAPVRIEELTLSLTKDAEGTGATDGSDNRGANFFANAWTAPLRIASFDITEDFNDVEATIYIYRGQEDPTFEGGVRKGYDVIPVGLVQSGHLNGNDPTAPKLAEVINPLQGFWLLAKLDAKKPYVELHPHQLIAGGNSKEEYTGQPELNPYHAPRRKVILGPDDEEEEEIPIMDMRLYLKSDDNFCTTLLLLESAAYTHDFDNGWDGRKWADDYGMPYLAAVSEVGDMAVLATPALDGTFLNFQQGTGMEYTFTFEYDGEEAYLLEDAYAGDAVEIRTGNSYTFTPSDEDNYRFRIVRKQEKPGITTEMPNVWVSGDQLYFTNPAGVLTEISIYGADGKLVEQIRTHEGTMQLHVPAEGVYMIRLQSELGTKTIKHVL